jgi:hypothetical protein
MDVDSAKSLYCCISSKSDISDSMNNRGFVGWIINSFCLFARELCESVSKWTVESHFSAPYEAKLAPNGYFVAKVVQTM